MQQFVPECLYSCCYRVPHSDFADLSLLRSAVVPCLGFLRENEAADLVILYGLHLLRRCTLLGIQLNNEAKYRS